MVAPLLIPALSKAAGDKSASLQHDLAVIRYHRPAGEIKRGRKKIQVQQRDLELHVNPIAIGVGVAAVAVGALALGTAAYASGMGIKREDGRNLTRKVVNTFDKTPEGLVWKSSKVYRSNGIPLRTLSDKFTVRGAYSDTQRLLADKELPFMYTVQSIHAYIDENDRVLTNTYVFDLHTNERQSWQLKDRPRGFFAGLGDLRLF